MQRLLTNAGPIAHLAGNGPIRGHIDDESELVAGAGLAILVEDHIVKKIGESEELETEFTGAEVFDLQGKSIIPGLVDSHTHLLWSGD